MINIQGPIILIQKTLIIRTCRRCGCSLDVILCSDETYEGGHYFGFGQPHVDEEGVWFCELCYMRKFEKTRKSTLVL